MLNERIWIIGAGLEGARRRVGLDGRDARRSVAQQHLVDEGRVVDRPADRLAHDRIREAFGPVAVRGESPGGVALMRRARVDPDLVEAGDRSAAGLQSARLQGVQDARRGEVGEVDLAGLQGRGHRVLVAEDLIDDTVDMGREAHGVSPVVGIAVELDELALHVLGDDERAGSDRRRVRLLLRGMVVVVEFAPDVLRKDVFVEEDRLSRVQRGRHVARDDDGGWVGRDGLVHQGEIRRVVGHVVLFVVVQRPRDIVGREGLPSDHFMSGRRW